MGGNDAALTAVVERTGIFPDSAAIKMRGDLISDDPERVAAAMTRATKAIAINPDAMSNVEGGAELENSALQFRSLVDDFGMTAQEAAGRMVREEKPELDDNPADFTPGLTALLGDPDEARRAELRRLMRENVIQAAGSPYAELIKLLLQAAAKLLRARKPSVPAPRGDRPPSGQSGGKPIAGQEELKELVDAPRKLDLDQERDVRPDEAPSEDDKSPGLPSEPSATAPAADEAGQGDEPAPAKLPSMVSIDPERLPAIRQQLRNMYEEAMQGVPTQLRRLMIGFITPEGATRINEVLRRAGIELDVTGYSYGVDADAVRHTIKKHGDEAREAPRGQLAVTAEDWARIPEILESPDWVGYAGRTRRGGDAIEFRKRVNGTMYYVAQARTGRRTLSAVTMWKMKSN